MDNLVLRTMDKTAVIMSVIRCLQATAFALWPAAIAHRLQHDELEPVCSALDFLHTVAAVERDDIGRFFLAERKEEMYGNSQPRTISA